MLHSHHCSAEKDGCSDCQAPSDGCCADIRSPCVSALSVSEYCVNMMVCAVKCDQC